MSLIFHGGTACSAPLAGHIRACPGGRFDGRGWFRTTDLSRVKRLGVREAERPDRPRSGESSRSTRAC